MAINTTIAITNPTKAKTYGLNDTIREDGAAYAAIYTVLNSETLKIKEGVFAINYLTGASACYIAVYLTINSVRFTIFEQYVAASTRGVDHTTLGDLGLTNIHLKTGDTIKIEYVYTTGTATPPTGDIKAALMVEDYTA